MISVAVCDDENYMRDMLVQSVEDFFCRQNIKVKVLPFSSGKELLAFDAPIDVCFLDIQMPPPDGMETAKRLREGGFTGILIFITVLEECVFHAFEVQAFDYLVKPVDKEKLHRTMDRLLDALKGGKEKSLFVHAGKEDRLIPFHDIVYCEVMNRKVYLHLKSRETVDYYEKLENLAAQSGGRLFRCHRSYLINLEYLRGFRDGSAYMKDGAAVPVSRLRNKEFSEAVLRHMGHLEEAKTWA